MELRLNLATHSHSTLARLWPVALFTCLIIALSSTQATASQTVAGHIETSRGTVEVLRTGDNRQAKNGTAIDAVKGLEILVGDQISTGRRSLVVVTLRDKTRFHLGANSEMVVGEFLFNRDPETDKVSAGMVKGVFRFISGEVAAQRAESMKVDVGKLGTIGIRGTHVGGEVEDTSARIVLLDPEESEPTSIQVSNDFGSVVIDEPGWGTEIPDEHSPPSLPRRMKLRGVENVMRSLQGASRIRMR